MVDPRRNPLVYLCLPWLSWGQWLFGSSWEVFLYMKFIEATIGTWGCSSVI